MSKQEILNRAKDRFINDQVEDSITEFISSKIFVSNVLFDYFAKDVAKMNTKEFKDYLQDDYDYCEETVDRYFKEQNK